MDADPVPGEQFLEYNAPRPPVALLTSQTERDISWLRTSHGALEQRALANAGEIKQLSDAITSLATERRAPAQTSDLPRESLSAAQVMCILSSVCLLCYILLGVCIYSLDLNPPESNVQPSSPPVFITGHMLRRVSYLLGEFTDGYRFPRYVRWDGSLPVMCLPIRRGGPAAVLNIYPHNRLVFIEEYMQPFPDYCVNAQHDLLEAFPCHDDTLPFYDTTTHRCVSLDMARLGIPSYSDFTIAIWFLMLHAFLFGLLPILILVLLLLPLFRRCCVSR